MDEGRIVEAQQPLEFFENPNSERAKLFLGQIIGHGP
jgi:general L-amino acid transport system ATP-binding protein